MNDDEFRRMYNYLLQGAIGVAGDLNLAASPATSTTIERLGVSSSSVVSLTPFNAAARTEGIPQVVPANGSFVLTHASSASTRAYRYVVHTPAGRT